MEEKYSPNSLPIIQTSCCVTVTELCDRKCLSVRGGAVEETIQGNQSIIDGSDRQALRIVHVVESSLSD